MGEGVRDMSQKGQGSCSWPSLSGDGTHGPEGRLGATLVSAGADRSEPFLAARCSPILAVGTALPSSAGTQPCVVLHDLLLSGSP